MADESDADVVVIGAGAAGILSATRLRDEGYSVILVEAARAGSAQSNHSHGYLHRGHIYASPKENFVRELNRGADSWISLFDEAGVAPVTQSANIAFHSRYNGKIAGERWAKLGMPYSLSETPAGFRPESFGICYETPEPAYDFTGWYSYTLSNAFEGIRCVRARAIELINEDQRIVGVRLKNENGETVTVSTSIYVLAAGTGNIDLASSAAKLRGRGVNRVSFMLVLEGELPPTSLIVPDHQSYGLFMVSRSRGGKNFWLVSNYISYAGCRPSAYGAILWARAAMKTLRRCTELIDEYRLNWGVYAAPKGELRADPRQMSEHSVESYGFENLLVAAPSKLTLAPLLAGKVVTLVHHNHRCTGRFGDPVIQNDALQVAPERWESVPLFDHYSLSDLLHGSSRSIQDLVNDLSGDIECGEADKRN